MPESEPLIQAAYKWKTPKTFQTSPATATGQNHFGNAGRRFFSFIFQSPVG
jgi:hypothetical protein